MPSVPVLVAVEVPRVVRDHLATAPVRVITVRVTEGAEPACGDEELLVPAGLPDEAVATWLREQLGDDIRGVLAVSDAQADRAARWSEALGVPGPGVRAVALAHDKARMRERLAAAGLPHVRWRTVASVRELAAFCSTTAAPVVLKPGSGSASRNVVRLDRPSDADALGELLRTEASWLAEELLEGPEVSVETLSLHGVHHVLAVTGKAVGAGFVETGHQVPAPLTEAERRDAAEETVRVLDALGFGTALGHTELILTAAGPRVVETHPRLGGDRIGRLVELVTGIHPAAALAAGICGGPARPTTTAVEAAAIAFVTAEPGTVRSVGGRSEALAMPGVDEVVLTVEPGDLVGPLRSSADRCGHVIATGGGPQEAAARAERARTAIAVTTR